ncbi:hypothetical protein ACJIZ3_006162 [Penstemon smallii]|uniref:Uncharacterized protein n=1 Tax=Penstemon smallii TaxID=265156 RepID=A0ABD3S722_9LAMI
MEKIYAESELFLLERFTIILLFFCSFLGNLWKLNFFSAFNSLFIVLYNTAYLLNFFVDTNSEESDSDSGSGWDADSPGDTLFDITRLERVASRWDNWSATELYAFRVERFAMLIVVIFTLFPLMTTFEMGYKVLGVSVVILFSSSNTLYFLANFPEHLLQTDLHIQKLKDDEEHNDDDLIEKVNQGFETDGVTYEENIEKSINLNVEDNLKSDGIKNGYAENKEEFEEKCNDKLKEENMKLGIEVADLKSQLKVYQQMLSQIINEHIHYKCEKETHDLSEKLRVAEASSQMYRALLHDLGSSQF